MFKLSPHRKAIDIIHIISVLPVLCLSAPSASLLAATIPDAGSILRDQQKPLQQPKEFPLPEEDKTLPARAGAGVEVEIKGFTFSGHEGIATEAELQLLVSGSRGKTLSFNELTLLADKITTNLKEKGWSMARAYLPAQDITSGIIHIAITQVKSDGRVTIKRGKSVRICDPVLQRFFRPTARQDKPINEHDLERSLLLINDTPGVSSKAFIVPDATTGRSRIEVAVTEGPLFSATLWGDNYGNYYTGAWRGNAMLSINDPFRYGDQMTLLLTEASGLAQGRVGYSFPIASNGIRGNLAYTGMRYELGHEFASLQYKGTSNSIDAGLSYPVLRSRNANFTTSLSYGFRSLIDTQADMDIRNKQINNATFLVSGDRYDQLFGGGYTSYNASVTTGKLHESVADVSLTGTEGSYTRFNAGLTRLQRVSKQLNVLLSGSAQMAGSNLDSSEKFTLGGPNGVRAYPVGEASGDEGQLINADLRYTLPLAAEWGTFQLNGFYDAGHIRLNKKRYAGDISNISNRNDYWLQGFGVGLSYSYSARASLRAIWAHCLGDNPGRSIAGKDSDGQSNKNRFWLQGTFSF